MSVGGAKHVPLVLSGNLESKSRRVPLQIQPPHHPLERIAMDIFYLRRNVESNTSWHEDYFTKWKETCPVKNTEATTIAQILINEFICRFEVPEHLHTDQGRNFEVEIIKEIYNVLNIMKTRTSPYHPQSDGMIERFNRTLVSMLSTVVDQDQKSWDKQLPPLMFAYRTSMQETNPFFGDHELTLSSTFQHGSMSIPETTLSAIAASLWDHPPAYFRGISSTQGPL